MESIVFNDFLQKQLFFFRFLYHQTKFNCKFSKQIINRQNNSESIFFKKVLMKMTIRKIWRKKQFINKFQAVSKEWIHTQERDVSVNTLTEAKKFPSGEQRAWTSKLCRQAEQLSPLLVSICVKFISLGANWYNKRIKPHKCNAEEAPPLTAF